VEGDSVSRSVVNNPIIKADTISITRYQWRKRSYSYRSKWSSS